MAVSRGDMSSVGGTLSPAAVVAFLWVTSLVPVQSLTELAEFKLGSIYTFRQPGKAFVEYMPTWSRCEKWGIEFTFRTHKANTMLLQNSFILDAAKADLWITLEKGQLIVKHQFNEDVLQVYCGKGLSHDHWHEVVVEVDLKAGNITCTVNGRDSVIATLRSEVLAQARAVLVDDPAPTHTALTSLGGFGPDSLETAQHYVGCMGNVTFFQDGRPLSVTLHRKEGVDLDCIDLCDADSPCRHGGRCVNHYEATSCDCFGTGYEGPHCNTKGSRAVTLQGSEWITYIIYDSDGKAHSPVNKVALEFKTRQSEGVLFFGYSQTQYNHLAISLRNATLHASVVFVDSKNYDELWLPVGSNLNDNRWHRVTVNHHGRDVTVTLDSHTEKMTASEGHQHLHMDPAVYFGGTERAHTGKGLRSQKNFVGCLRSLYFNHNPILEKTDEDRAKIHGSNPQLGCLDMTQRILQFTHQGAFVKVEHAPSESLEVMLQFRTLKPDAVLVYSLAHSGGDDGYVQVLLKAGQVQVLVVPSVSRPTIKQSATTGEGLNDNQWHTLQLKYEEGTTQIEVDGEQSIASFPWKIKLSRATFLGFGPDSKMKYGFVGCMQEIQVQEAKVKPLEVVHSELGVGVSVGPCSLQDWCTLNGSSCLNQGHCINDWHYTYCDCSHTQYEGKYCQFAKLLRSCDEYYQQLPANERRSGVWSIDVDGSGPAPQSHVYCEMGVVQDGARYGTTWVSHNLEAGTPVRGPWLQDLKKVVTYRELEPRQLTTLVQISSHCLQFIQINCSMAPLRLGELTWLLAASGQRFTTLGGNTPDACDCYERTDCLEHQRCNCDAEGGIASWDGGFLNDRSHLPVTELVFKQGVDHQGLANVTMGPLKCSGTYGQDLTSTVTFIGEEVFLELPGWQGGEIRFDFQTRQQDGVLLYQPEVPSHHVLSGQPVNRWKDAQLYVLLRRGNMLIVMIEGMDVWQTVTSESPLNDGRWQHITIEVLHGQLRVTLNRRHFIHDLGKDTIGPGSHAQPMYVGGKPRTNINDLKGFVGCIKGLSYNKKVFELGSISDRPGISLGCSPACASNPCVNGAQCEEHWSSYSCRCLSPFSQSGKNCENDINSNSVSFLSSRSFIKIVEESSIELIQQEIIMSFRTVQPASLLLYIHDHVNNFLQVDVTTHITLTITYNCEESIVQRNLTIHGMTDGTWKQMAILPDKDKVVVNFDGTEIKIEQPWKMLTDYSVTPFNFQETVEPQRETIPKSPVYTAYLGGAPEQMTNLTGFVGCLRGVKLAGTVHDLHKAADSVEGVQEQCPQGCTSNPCVNHGRCEEGGAFDGFYTCDCIHTGFSGTYCDKEIGLYFGGLSYIMMIVRTQSPDLVASPSDRPAGFGLRDSLQFNFATYNSVDQHSRAMVLVQCEEDYMVIYLSSDGRVYAEYFIDGFSVLLESDVHYTTGWPHHVTLTRDQGHVSLKVDHSVIQHEINASLTMEKPIRIIVGGALDVNGQLSYLVNFTGDISNVFFTSDWLVGVNARPLDAYHGLTVDTPDQVTVEGPVHDATQVLGGYALNMGPILFDIEPQDASPQMYSFPPWRVGPAQTVELTTVTENSPHKLEADDIAGIVVSLSFLAFVSGIIAFLIWRSVKKRQTAVALQKNIDEEEGLMGIGYRNTSGTETSQVAEQRTKPKNGRKKMLSAAETMDGFEDEETPMLSLIEEPTISEPTQSSPIQMSPFPSDIPLIDEDSDEEIAVETEKTLRVLQSTETSHISADSHTDAGSSQGTSIVPPSVQVEWDPRAERPSALDNIEGRKQQQQQAEMRESRGRRVPPSPKDEAASSTSSSSSTANVVKASPIAKPGAPTEVWTESQVLDFLDSDDTTGESSWDPSGDTLDEVTEEEEGGQLPSVQTACHQNNDNRNNNAATDYTNDTFHDGALLKTETLLSLNAMSLDLQNSQDTSSDKDSAVIIEPVVIVVHNGESATPFHVGHNNQNGIIKMAESLNATSELSETVAGDSEGDSEDSGSEQSGARSQLKLNTAIKPFTPPYGKSPGISQSKGKLKLKAKKNSRGKK